MLLNEDCLKGTIPSESVDLGIHDPPFGINESSFNKHYNRNKNYVIQGYQEAPEDYKSFTYSWLKEAKRVLKENGSMYVFMGHTNLRHLLNAAHVLNLYEINHIIWRYNFGVFTRNKFVTSHYHILYYSKSKNYTFNTNCRFGSQEKEKGKSLLYKDLEDVFAVNKEYSPKEIKNQNKLPEELIKKLILYSSNQGDTICDFFLGNFTTAYASLKLNRKISGCEINSESYNHHINKLKEVDIGCDIKEVIDIKPENQGKRLSQEEINSIIKDYKNLEGKMKKYEINKILQEKYKRGRFSITNILKKYS